MYILEDDQDTSENLRKKDILNTSYTQAVPYESGGQLEPGTMGASEDFGWTGGTGGLPQAQPPTQSAFTTTPKSSTSPFARLFSPQQITSSFRALATPGKKVSSVGGGRAALLAMIVACIAVFLTALDQTVVVTVLPKIIADPGINISFVHIDHAAWIISAYLLGFIIAMPLMGRISDIYGRRRILLLCLLIFGVGSVLCGFAPFFGENIDLSFLSFTGIDTSSPGLIFLISARFLQAIGGGAVVPVALAIASDFYGQARRGLALGIVGAVTEAGGVVGPLYGAVVAQRLDWTYIFYFNAPIVLALMAATWFIIPKGKRLNDGIDWIGAALLGAALTCLSLGLAQQGSDLGPTTVNGSTPQNNPISLALAIIFLVIFVIVERRVRHPVIDLSVFKRFTFSASALVSLLVGAALIIAMADIPLFVDTVLSKSIPDDQVALFSGLALMRLTVMIPIGAFLGGWLSSRITSRVTGVIGLLFAAVGFYLMSRWSANVDWNQITVSTVTAGLGFGLVIAPISTTAINSVRARQTGMGAAIVTSLRMAGMIFGLAALTSWALAYFKQLASTFPSLPTTATADQFAQWSKDYADHLIASARMVYSSVFFATMFLCLLAIVPALFLWGNKKAVSESESEEEPGAIIPAVSPSDPTEPAPALLAGTFLAGADLLDTVDPVVGPPVPPTIDGTRNGNNGRRPRGRRKKLLLALCALLLLLLIGGISLAIISNQPDTSGTSPTGTGGVLTTGGATATPVSGPRMIELALNDLALTSIFVKQLGSTQGALTDIAVTPTAHDGIVISLNLHIDASGIHRVLPIELDGIIGLDKQANIAVQVLHLKRDGLDAGQAAALNMQQGLNQLLMTSVMPQLRATLKTAKLVAVHTSTTVGCGGGMEMLTLLIMAPPIQGIAAQPTPTAFCFKGPIDFNNLLPS